MKNKKSGFTLSEILVSMLIVGVIMAIAVQAIRMVKSSYTSIAYYTFNTIKLAVSQLYENDSVKIANNTGNRTVSFCTLDNGMITSVLKPDIAPPDNSNTIPTCKAIGTVGTSNNIFCRSLVSMMNTSGSTNCSSFFTPTGRENGIPYPTNSDLSGRAANFTTTNGHKYYISAHRPYDSNITTQFGYRIIAVDLNGKERPNIPVRTATDKLPPDIISFLILDNGEVYPLREAADNHRLNDTETVLYLNARVKGYYFWEDKNRKNTPEECYKKVKTGKKQTCNYGVVYIENPKKKEGNSKTFFTYREAYCTAIGANKTPILKSYCKEPDGTNINASTLCKPTNNSKAFDLCQIDLVKPAFRFNFN